MGTRAVVPMGCLYTPKKDLENIAKLEYDPVKCKCGAILNPYCNIDY
jgi:protein transport protein SEC23